MDKSPSPTQLLDGRMLQSSGPPLLPGKLVSSIPSSQGNDLHHLEGQAGPSVLMIRTAWWVAAEQDWGSVGTSVPSLRMPPVN